MIKENWSNGAREKWRTVSGLRKYKWIKIIAIYETGKNWMAVLKRPNRRTETTVLKQKLEQARLRCLGTRAFTLKSPTRSDPVRFL